MYDSRLGLKVGRERIEKVERVVEKWGAFAVYGCFWVPMLRHTLPWVAGALRVSYPWYVVASALGCLTWAPLWWFGLFGAGCSWPSGRRSRPGPWRSWSWRGSSCSPSGAGGSASPSTA